MIDQQQAQTATDWLRTVPLVVSVMAAVINGLIALILKSWGSRLVKIEDDNAAIWRKISAFELANARNGATRHDLSEAIKPLQTHLLLQDTALHDIQLKLAVLTKRSDP